MRDVIFFYSSETPHIEIGFFTFKKLFFLTFMVIKAKTICYYVKDVIFLIPVISYI